MKSSSLLTTDQSLARQPDHAGQDPRSFSTADFAVSTVDEPTWHDDEAATKSIDLRAFRQLSGSYADEGSSFGARLEVGVFILVIAITAWPLTSLLKLMSETGYW